MKYCIENIGLLRLDNECTDLHWVQGDAELGGLLGLLSSQWLVGGGEVLNSIWLLSRAVVVELEALHVTQWQVAVKVVSRISTPFK